MFRNLAYVAGVVPSIALMGCSHILTSTRVVDCAYYNETVSAEQEQIRQMIKMEQQLIIDAEKKGATDTSAIDLPETYRNALTTSAAKRRQAIDSIALNSFKAIDECDSIPTGLAYSLPKGQIQLTASRHLVQPSDLTQAQNNYDQATANVAKDKKALSDALTKGDASAIAAAKQALDDDQKSADTGRVIRDKLVANINKFVETASITVLSPGPDPTARYVTDLNHYPIRDDSAKFNVTNGLLNTASLVTTDQSAAIIQTLADTAIAIAALSHGIPLPGNFAMLPPVVKPKEEAAPGCPDNPYDIQKVFDPFDAKQVSDVKALLIESSSYFDLTLDPNPDLAQPAPPNIGTRLKLTQTGSISGKTRPITVSGFVYRVPTGVNVTIRNKKSADDIMKCDVDIPKGQSLAATVPDTRADFVVEAEGGVFTTANLTWGFSNGMLTDYSSQRPSEMLAVAKLPLTIINDLFSIPTQLLQLRVNYDTTATAAVNGDANLRKAQLDQLTTVINAQTALMQAQINQPTAVAQAQMNYINALQSLAKSIAAFSATQSQPK